MAEQQHADSRRAWRTALKSLQRIPLAVADRSMPKDELHDLASQAEVDCRCAAYPAATGDRPYPQQLQLALEQAQGGLQIPLALVVDTLQIPLHLSKAVALLLPIPFTFHMAVELLAHLATLLHALLPNKTAGDPSTPSRALAASTQIAASGLLQQLPAALQTAQQQLRQLKLQGWCGTACHYCEGIQRGACKLGVTDPATDTLQENLLQACSELLQFWPGSLGALGSAAVGPTLIPAAQLALSSLQYACRRAGEQRDDSSSSSSSPPLTLADLGRRALDTCAVLTCAADGCGRQLRAAAGSSRQQYAEELLSSPELLSAAVKTMNADVYGRYDADSIMRIAASDPVVPDLSDVGLLYMTAPRNPGDNLPAVAWQQLCAREASLEPGQGLLPPLQQQLLDALGCNSKGFLWLAPVWKARRPAHLMPVAVRVCSLIGGSMSRKMGLRSSATVASGHSLPAGVTDAVLRLFLLLPAVALRMELHQQRVSASSGAAGQGEYDKSMHHAVSISAISLHMLRTWRELRDFMASTGADAGASRAAGMISADRVVPTDALFVPMLHEVLQLLMRLLQGVMQTPPPGSSSIGSSGGSSTRHGSQCNASTSIQQPERTISPAAAASVLSGLIAVLLPAATQAVMEHSASTPTSNTAATGSSSRSRRSSLAATWVPLLLRLLGALEQAMRFEAQWGPSQPELEASEKFDCWGELAGQFTQGPAWGATFLLLSQRQHAAHEWLEALPGPDQTPAHSNTTSSHDSQPALLQWMLDNTPRRQLQAVQERVLSVLCTAAKVCLSAEGRWQLVQVSDTYSCIFHTAWGVLGRLLPLQTAPTGANAAATTAGMVSSHSSSSSSQGLGVAQPSAGSPNACADAALSWLSLVGRCFLQASAQMDSTLKLCAADADLTPSSSSQQQQQQQAQPGGRAHDSWAMVVSVCKLGAHILPQCIGRVAVLTAAAAGGQGNHPSQQLEGPEQLPAAAADAVRYVWGLATVTDEEEQQLVGAGQQLAAHCSSLGIDLTALHNSARAVAFAARVAQPYLFNGIKSGVAAANTGPATRSMQAAGQTPPPLLSESASAAFTERNDK